MKEGRENLGFFEAAGVMSTLPVRKASIERLLSQIKMVKTLKKRRLCKCHLNDPNLPRLMQTKLTINAHKNINNSSSSNSSSSILTVHV